MNTLDSHWFGGTFPFFSTLRCIQVLRVRGKNGLKLKPWQSWKGNEACWQSHLCQHFEHDAHIMPWISHQRFIIHPRSFFLCQDISWAQLKPWPWEVWFLKPGIFGKAALKQPSLGKKCCDAVVPFEKNIGSWMILLWSLSITWSSFAKRPNAFYSKIICQAKSRRNWLWWMLLLKKKHLKIKPCECPCTGRTLFER